MLVHENEHVGLEEFGWITLALTCLVILVPEPFDVYYGPHLLTESITKLPCNVPAFIASGMSCFLDGIHAEIMVLLAWFRQHPAFATAALLPQDKTKRPICER